MTTNQLERSYQDIMGRIKHYHVSTLQEIYRLQNELINIRAENTRLNNEVVTTGSSGSVGSLLGTRLPVLPTIDHYQLSRSIDEMNKMLSGESTSVSAVPADKLTSDQLQRLGLTRHQAVQIGQPPMLNSTLRALFSSAGLSDQQLINELLQCYPLHFAAKATM